MKPIKTLSRHTVCQLFEIRAPRWQGSPKRRIVGLNEQRIGFHNEIHFMYKRKSDGQLSMPDKYYFDGNKLKQIDFERQVRHGTTLVLIPLSELEILVRE